MGVFSHRPTEERVCQVIENIFGQKPIFTTAGRTSLYAILKSLSLPPGSLVGVPLFCCDVVFDSIRRAGFVPRFIDVESYNYNLSASDLEKKREDLAALIVVHMFGHPAHMDEIRKVAAGIPIIEDCAHSLFSKYKGTYTGLLSTASFFSFRSGKYVSAGEGSAILSRDRLLLESIAEFGRLFKARKLSAEPLALHGDICQISSIPQTLVWCGGLSDRKMA